LEREKSIVKARDIFVFYSLRGAEKDVHGCCSGWWMKAFYYVGFAIWTQAVEAINAAI
jgi:hypothetical protein